MARARRWILPGGGIALGLSAIGLLFIVITGPQKPKGPGSAELDRVLPVDPRPLPVGAIARLGFIRGNNLAGRKEVGTAAYSSDGKVIVTSDWTGAANIKAFQLWNAESGERLGEVTCPFSVPYSVSLSPDGKRLACSGNEGVAVLSMSGPTTGKVIWRSHGVIGGAFTPDGSRLVASQFYGALLVMDAETSQRLHTLREPGRYVKGSALSADGSTLVAMTEKITDNRSYDPPEPRVEVWDLKTGRLRRIVAEQRNSFGFREGLAVSHDGRAVAFSGNGSLALVDVETRVERWRVSNPVHHHFCECLSISPSGDVMLVIRNDIESVRVSIELLDMTSGQRIRTLDADVQQLNQAVFSPDGRRIITYGQGVPVRVWEVASGKLIPAYDGHRVPPHLLAMSDNGDSTVSGDPSYSVCAWSDLALHNRFDVRFARNLGLSGDGRTAIVTTRHYSTQLLELAEGTRRVLKQNRSEYSAISRDGRWAAVGVFDGIEMIDVASGDVRGVLKGHTGEPYALSFSADGRCLLSATKTRRIRRNFGGTVSGPPDDTIRVWDPSAGQELRRWELAAACAAISPQGKMVLAGCADGRLRRMRVETGEELDPLMAHAGGVVAVAVSAGGRRAATAGADGIIVWDPIAGHELNRLVPDHGATTALAFSGNGRQLASAGTDGTILVWDVSWAE